MSTNDKNKEQNNLDETTKIVIAALAGAAVGATVALLFAPASGKETRDNLAELLGSVKESLADFAEEGQEMAAKAADKAQEVVKAQTTK